MSAANISPAEVQKARSFLYANHKRGFRISPKKFAASSRELGVGFRELLGFIGRLQSRGQQRSTHREEVIRKTVKGSSK